MGGGQTNSAQAAQADAASMAASQASAALSTTQNAEQQQSYNYLFGDPSTPGSTGTLTQFMNPNALNVTTPTGAFGAQYNQATDTLAQNYANQRGSLAQQFANQGFTGSGAPSGFQAEQENQLGQAQANAQGNLFASTVGQEYQTNLNNFWNANNIAAGQSANLAGTADSASAQSGSTANGVYQTAGAATPGALNSAIGAVGTVGSGIAQGAGTKKACWIAEAIFGVDAHETHLLRYWLNNVWAERSLLGRAVMGIYGLVGQRVAAWVRRYRWVRNGLTPLFRRALKRAQNETLGGQAQSGRDVRGELESSTRSCPPFPK
jgi:hypothetical protein